MLLKMQMDKWRGHKSPSFAAQRLSAHDRFFASPPHIRCISGSNDSCTSGPHSAARDTAISSISRMVRLKNVLGTRSTKKVAQGNFCSRKAGKVHEYGVGIFKNTGVVYNGKYRRPYDLNLITYHLGFGLPSIDLSKPLCERQGCQESCQKAIGPTSPCPNKNEG